MRIVVLGAMWPHEENLLHVRAAGHDVVYLHLSEQPSWRELAQHVPCVSARPGEIAGQVLALHRCRPVDVVLSLLNYEDRSAHVTAELLDARLGIPIVRQYKEHLCRPETAEGRCLTETAAQIYINEESLVIAGD